MAKSGFSGKNILINLIVTIVAGFIYFYVELPPINLHSAAFYSFFLFLSVVYCITAVITSGIYRQAENGKTFWKLLKGSCIVPLIVIGAVFVIYVVGGLLSSVVIRSGAYAKLITVETGDFTQDIEEISFDQIPMLDRDSAEKLGDRKLGELADMVSQFEVADNYTQINYKGRPVRVTPLRYGDIFKWLNNRSAGLPAYLIIDMVTQEVDVVRLPEGMHYTTAEHFSRNLYRHLRFQYPTYIFNEPTFEIDEEGTPYWVCPRIVKRIGLFGGTDIQGAVLVNAITGESQYYTDIPTWVDGVYSAEIIMDQYDYYGTYQGGFINSLFGQKNVTVTTEGYNYIAANDDVYVYTGVTSAGSDESNIGFILTNQRTKQTTFYSIAGAEEFSAMNSAEGVVQHLNYSATFPLLLNISNQPTYFMALKDYAGLVKMYAMVNVQQYQIVATGASVEECQSNYYKLLRQNKLDTGEAPILPADEDTVTGIVTALRSAVIDGTTMYYVTLDADNTVYCISAGEVEKVILLNVGDRITITYEPDSMRDDLICTANAFEWTVAEEPTEPAEESELPEGPAEAA
ncbi:MAG: CvpA family protein [Angelakisella sp.]|jgi:hypothetical protein|uniref:CvpA family protein n=1 Tax=Angelakisella sp. TaxID=1935177 RepID=UPI0015A703F2